MRRPCLRSIARAVSLRSGRKPGGPASIPFAPSVAISVSTRLGSSCGPHAAASLMPHETGDTATVAFPRAKEGETTTTSNLQVDYYRPASPGRLIARASVRHRSRRLAYSQATVEQADGVVVAECRAVIAYVKA